MKYYINIIKLISVHLEKEQNLAFLISWIGCKEKIMQDS
jgi:hypothetical protein